MYRRTLPESKPVNSSSRNYTYVPIHTQKPVQEAVQRPHIMVRSDKLIDRELQMLRKANQELKQRQEVYIDKLMKLEEGLQNQHRQFIKLQELYTQLFQCYKKKQLQIAELEYKYRQSSRSYHTDRQIDLRQSKRQQLGQNKDAILAREKVYSLKQTEWISKQKEWRLRQNQLTTINEDLTEKLLIMNEKYEKVIQLQANNRNGKQKPIPRMANQDDLLEQIKNWQLRFQAEKEDKIKFQYENQFLKNRNHDIQSQKEQLELLLAYKQKEITKLREEKIKIHRQTSQKLMSRSPSKSSRTVLRNHSPYSNKNDSIDPNKETSRDGTLNEESHDMGSKSLQKYFSFSREKKESNIEESLPSFPAQLEIDSLISQHKK